MPRESASSDSEDDDEACQSGEWLVLRLLPGLLGASRRWQPRPQTSRKPRGCESWEIPVEGKPVEVRRPEPLVCSQGRGCCCARLSPYSPNDVSPNGGPAVAGLTGATWGRGPRDRCMRRSDRRTLARIGGCGRRTGPVRKAGPLTARDPLGMVGVPATAGGHGGRFVADACKRQHMGTVVGHRGMGVPVGPRRTLIKGGLFHALPLRRLRVASR